MVELLSQDDVEESVFDPLVDVISYVLVGFELFERSSYSALLDVEVHQSVFRQRVGNLVFFFPNNLRNIVVDQILQSCIRVDEHHVHVVVVFLDLFQVALE